jgi:SAM-dependent methyltransferase
VTLNHKDITMKTDESILRGWDAAYRDNDTDALWNEAPMPIVSSIADQARALGLTTCADLGCGDGRNLLGLQAGGLDVLGLDISPMALRRADALLRAKGRPVPLVVGDIAALPFASGTLDVVTALDVGGQVPDPAPMLAEALRVLRRGGMLVINLFTRDDETYGEGTEIAPDTFMYKETLFRYFGLEEVQRLFATGWDVTIERRSWVDPPHGAFRPRSHRHDNYVVTAVRA